MNASWGSQATSLNVTPIDKKFTLASRYSVHNTNTNGILSFNRLGSDLEGSLLLLSGESWDWRKKFALAGMLVLSQLGGAWFKFESYGGGREHGM